MVSLYIHFLLLLFWTLAQTLLLFYSSILSSSILLSSLSHHLFPQILSLDLLKSPLPLYSPLTKSSIRFSFQIFADSPYTYDNTDCTYSSTIVSLILILMYNLQVIKKPKTLFVVLSNVCSFATFILDQVLGWKPSFTIPATNNNWICTYIATSYSCCYLIIWCKLC